MKQKEAAPGNNVQDIKEMRGDKAKLRAEYSKKARLAKERAENTVMLAIEKAVAHYENPSMYPLPAENKTVECAFHSLLNALPKNKRKKIVEKVNETLKATPGSRAEKYKDIVNVDFRSAKPIVEQVKNFTVPEHLKFTNFEAELAIDDIKNKAVNITTAGSLKPQLQQAADAATKVSFFVDSMTCNNPDDIHKDEISIGGFAVDTAGNLVQLAPFFVGKFRKDETVNLNGSSRLFTLNIDPNVDAQNFLAGLFIVESDLVSNKDVLNSISFLLAVIGLTMMVISIALVAAAILGASVPLLVIAILFIGGGFLNAVSHYLPLIGDDISVTTTDSLAFVGKQEVGLTFSRSIVIGKGFDINEEFDGKYTAAARWVTEI